jgi:hypothetical protein
MNGSYPSGASDAASAGVGFAVLACWGILLLVALALFAFTVWMIIDALGRQEYEFPGSTGNSKNLYVILMIVGIFFSFGWIVALVYYFKVFKVVKRGTMAPPAGYAPAAPPMYAPAAPPAPPVYAPPAPPAPPAYAPPAPPAPPMPAPEPPAAPPMTPPEMPAPPAPPAPPAE